MASPVVQEAIESSTNTAGTSHVVTLPTATANQLLLIILDKGSKAATFNAHTELTELLDENLANGLYIAYRWMNGSEPASYTLTSTASTRSARIAYRLSGAENPATTAPQIGTTSSGSSATPDPPVSATPPSSKDYLFIAFYGAANEEADDDTWSDTPPTSYTPSPPRQKACGTVGTNLGGMIAAAERQLTTGSAQDPGTFAKDVSAAWRAQTITIHPLTSQTFQQAIAAVAVGVAVLAKVTTFLRTLASVAVGVPVIATVMTAVRALAATAVGVATLTPVVLIPVVLAATVIGVATLTPALLIVVILAAVAAGTAVLSPITTFVRTLAAVAVGSAVLARITTFFRTLAATSVGAAVLTPARFYAQAVAATAIGLGSLVLAKVFRVTLVATSGGSASIPCDPAQRVFIYTPVRYPQRTGE